MTAYAVGSIQPTHIFRPQMCEIVWWDMNVGCSFVLIIVVYLWSNCSIKEFCNLLCDLLNTSMCIVVVGDFNLDAKTPLPATLTSFFSTFSMTQVVNEVTTVNHTIIDHVWTNAHNLSTFVLTSYFSDHFPIVLDFQEWTRSNSSWHQRPLLQQLCLMLKSSKEIKFASNPTVSFV